MSVYRELIGSVDGKETTFAFNEVAFKVTSQDKTIYQSTPYHVLWVSYDHSILAIQFLVKGKEKKASNFSLVNLLAGVKDDAREWSEALMQAAYQGTKLRRKLKVFVNPYAGTKKSRAHFNKIVEPILKAAQCTVHVVYTEYAKHAQELAKVIPLDYDAILTLSGDGLAHEIWNGFAQHSDPKSAFSIPLAPIPTGSANGTCLNILGMQDGDDIAMATLNAVKGRPMRVDLCSVTQDNTRTFSYMSQAVGLMADLDVGTNNLRWMGSARFSLGYFRGVLANQPCPIAVSIKVAEADKHKLLKAYHSMKESRSVGDTPSEDPLLPQDEDWSPLPPIKYSKKDTDGWVDIDLPILFLYAGKAPFASNILMQWPMAVANDGLVDVVIQEIVPRIDLVKAMGGAGAGDSFFLKTQHYFKAQAYRVRTLGRGNLSLDGEEFPFKDFEVEVHQGMGAFLSPFGHYPAEFHPSLSL